MSTNPDLLTKSYHYDLPPELIASKPPEQRDAARMMVIHRSKQQVEHRNFLDLESYLSNEDCVVMNNAKVTPARFFSFDGKIEILWQETLPNNTWRVLGKPGRKLKAGRSIQIGDCEAEVVEVLENGDRILAWRNQQAPDFETHGQLALPHYLGREATHTDSERYQTVYAKQEGAIAAPTAGLHFTPELIQRLDPAWLTLFVGVGTFRPVSAEDLSGHSMHSERYALSEENLQRIQAAKRTVAVGTTVVRVLEHLARTGGLRPEQGSTDIFLHPPHKFQAVDALLTNFHLPESTLLMLVSAFLGSREFALEAYRKAVAEKYRFFSYGDCMLIL